MTAILSGVPSASLPDVWPTVAPMLAEATARSRGRHDAQDLLRLLVARQAQLWLAIEDKKVLSAGVTEIVNHPKKQLLRLFIVTGDQREKWQHFMADLEEWAKVQGCQGVELVARPGWEKPMKRQGYEKTHVVLEKELD